jgi:ubiquinone/menaquinone biosynthesis C-methylase UbiE
MASQSRFRILRLLSGLAALIGIIYALWWRKHPSPCPYSQRFWVKLPRPVITRSRLQAILKPQPDERILEIGPGTGYYTLPVAHWLDPHGTLHVLDIQQEMLDHTRIQARKQGRWNVEVMNADAQHLPYPDDSFNAAYLVLVLGEVPNQELVLQELSRILKPGGRLIVGELLPDPHFVTVGALQRRAERHGFQFTEQSGYRFGYFARFHVPS